MIAVSATAAAQRQRNQQQQKKRRQQEREHSDTGARIRSRIEGQTRAGSRALFELDARQ